MSDKPDGGPAFPAPDYIVDSARITHEGFQRMGATRGLSLRDYFAAKAVAALSVDMDWSDDTVSATVNMAYRVADAMLAERDLATKSQMTTTQPATRTEGQTETSSSSAAVPDETTKEQP